MTFGLQTVLSWDLDRVQAVGKDLQAHEQQLRACFTDFRGSSDLAHAWSGAAADAQHVAAARLATDLYDLTDMIGLLGNQIGRKGTELVEYQNAIRHARSEALSAEFDVADDGTVTLPPAKPGQPPRNRAILEDEQESAQTFQTTLVHNLQLAAAADIDLAKALAAAENTICQHSSPDVVKAAVAFQFGPVLHPTADPFLSDVTVGGAVPSPTDPNFTAYWQALTAFEKQQVLSGWNQIGKDFNPYSTVQGGALPAWATAFNQQSQNACPVDADGRPTGPGYGYFGGGTIMGPDGRPWPIVAPYYSDGTHVYLADGGQQRTDGGISQLDGQDPGWHTVSSYDGLNQFGTISATTKIIVGGEVASGQEIETNPTDPGAVSIGPDGRPVVGETGPETPDGPADKPYWDVKPSEGYNTEEAAAAANVGVVQGAQAAGAIHDVDSHGQRDWQVQYQVNDDGRVRAVVNTYTAGPSEDGGTNVGSFNNAFPTGQSGTTHEIPIDTRYTPYDQPTLTPGTPSNVHYLGDPSRNGELLDNGTPIQEKLNK